MFKTINPWLAFVVLLFSASAGAAEIGYIEDFALAADRAAALKQLIPGTEDYYYYHCLHFQNTEQFDQVEELLGAWIQRHNYTPRVHEIQNRQALLTYGRNPQKALELLRQRLNLQFNHQRETLNQKPNLPTRLEPGAISRGTLTSRAFQTHKNLEAFEDGALDWLVGTELTPERRRHLLQRLQRPDYPNLPKLVVDDLAHLGSGAFGALPIHRQLLQSQLDECLKLNPELLNQSGFVGIYLAKLRPHADGDWKHEPAEFAAYLDRLWNFAQKLAPVHNSLKAHILYQRLVFDRAQGVPDKARFLAYLQLPRRVSYINEKYLNAEPNQRHPADLNADFQAVTQLPPVGDDEPLVRSYLHHFFVDEANFKPYEPYINDVYLRRQFAETKVVHGLGEGEQWSAQLPPAEFQALKDRVDIDFAHTNKRLFAADDPVRLDLDIKNVRTLIVKVFEINARNFYRENLREVNTDINLDGLVANWETSHEYPEPPLRRARRHFEFPQLTRPGVYVVDFIGNGKSSRVVVRKSRLHYLVRTTTAGQVFTVQDEQHRRLPQAAVWFAGRDYPPDDKGEILVPFSNAPQQQPIILAHGDFCWLERFQHEGEDYRLAAGIFVDRESLLAHNRATVIVRPQLYLNGTPVTLSVLEDVRLVITSTDLEGVATTKEVKDFALYEDRESAYEFQTPPRLASVRFALQAKVQNLSQNKKIDLATQETFTLNEIDRTPKIEDVHLAWIEGQYAVELLGKSGEAKPDRAVRLVLKHRDFCEPVHATLQTDERGRVHLGPLADIASLTATGPEDTSHTWNLIPDQHTQYSAVHGREGDALVVPYPGAAPQPRRDELSLLELRGDTFVADRFEALAIDGGLLQIAGLPRGDYDLWLKRDGRHVQLRVAAGVAAAGCVLGRHRQLEVRNPQPLQIAAVAAGAETLAIRLQNASPHTRVHVFATRYQPAFAPFAYLSRVGDANPFWMTSPAQESWYVAGRNIGDEYRYIIDRKYAKKFPGNMAERPSLLLNPWAVRSTETAKQEAAAGEAFGVEGGQAAGYGGRAAAKKAPVVEQPGFSSLEFLGAPAVVLLNLKPDEAGKLTVARKDLGPHQHVQVVAIDPRSTACRAVSLPELPLPPRDLRLAAGLDPQKHFAQQKQISVVDAKQPFVVADINSSRFELYDTLARVYSLYVTLSGDAKLIEFGFVTNWPNLKPEEKRARYSKYACHELNLFLYHKDREFFGTVVQPYLKNKKEKQFLDRWLLGDDVSPYLQPWHYGQLNVVERILLSQRVAADRPETARHVRDLFALVPPDVDRFLRLFETALKGSALDTDDRLGVRLAREKAAKAEAKPGEGRLERLEQLAERSQPATAAAAPAEPAAPPPPPRPARPQSEGKEREALGKRLDAGRLGADKAGAVPADGKGQMAFFGRDLAERRGVQQYYRQLDKTQEWAENQYYRLPLEQQSAELITVNAFWRDYAGHDPAAAKPFRSVQLAEAARNFPEMMFALAVLDLPFAAEKHETRFERGQMTLGAGSPTIIYHEEIKATRPAEQQTPILVSQNFFRQSDRYRQEGDERLDKFITDEFLVHVVYGCQIVVTNPTSSKQKLDVLLQIPAGALPVAGGQATRSVHVDLEPYATKTLEYSFYFPAAGEFRHYPVHVSKREQLVAHAAPMSFKVVKEPTRIDRESWEYISQFGTDDDVLKFLEQHNLHRLNLDKIAFRMREPAFFQKAIQLLARRHVYQPTLWSYAVRHNEPAAIGQFLLHANEFVAQCGDWLDSPLLRIDPVARRAYQHLDYKPLVNARAHPLGKRRQIVNDRFHQQYHRLLKIFGYRRTLDDDDRMALTYYLLLQDRIEQALEAFRQVNPDKLATRLQYDYFQAYLDLFQLEPKLAPAIVAKYAAYPVDRWRDAFAAIGVQLAELSGKDPQVVDRESRDQVQAGLAAAEASFDLAVEAKQVALKYQNLAQVQVNYYRMDIELLFSRNPFVQQYSGQFSFIRPNQQQTVKLPAGQTAVAIPLPPELQSSNVLVEITGGGKTKSQAYYANALAVQVIENYGQVRVTHSAAGKPLAQVYVKVYAEMQDGGVKFYKDGYTDLRGRFDYASLSTSDLEHVKRFSLLVLSDEHGAVVREATPPKR